MKKIDLDKTLWEQKLHRNPTVCEVGIYYKPDGKGEWYKHEVNRLPYGSNRDFDVRPFFIGFHTKE